MKWVDDTCITQYNNRGNLVVGVYKLN